MAIIALYENVSINVSYLALKVLHIYNAMHYMESDDMNNFNCLSRIFACIKQHISP